MRNDGKVRDVTRRRALATGATALAVVAAPAIVKAQAALKVTFAQQRGLLYLPIDMMVSGGVLQKEADKAGLGKIDASVTTLNGPGPVIDALLSGAVDYGTTALPSLLTLWGKTRGTPNEVRAVGAISNGAMTLYSINPAVKTIADFSDRDKIAVPTAKLSFNAMMLQMAAEKLWGDPFRLDRLTVSLGHPDAVAAMAAGFGKATVSAHVAVQPFTEAGLRFPGAHVVADSREVFGGAITQITMPASRRTRERNPDLFKVVGAALQESIRVCNADKRASSTLWKTAQNAPEGVDELVHLLDDPGFEFTAQPKRIIFFANFLERVGQLKVKPAEWKDVFWETSYNQTEEA